MTNLQRAIKYYAVAKEVWTLANQGKTKRNVAAKHLNKGRAFLQREIRLVEAYLGKDHRV